MSYPSLTPQPTQSILGGDGWMCELVKLENRGLKHSVVEKQKKIDEDCSPHSTTDCLVTYWPVRLLEVLSYGGQEYQSSVAIRPPPLTSVVTVTVTEFETEVFVGTVENLNWVFLEPSERMSLLCAWLKSATIYTGTNRDLRFFVFKTYRNLPQIQKCQQSQHYC